MSTAGDSNAISRNYLDSLLIETRYMNSTSPSTSFELFGRTFASPIMTAALSHLDHMGAPGMAKGIAEGARDAGCVMWYGMAPDEEIDMLAGTGVQLIEIIKPYADRDLIFRKIEHARSKGLLAVGIDIDHPFGSDGSPDVCDGYELRAMTTAEMTELCAFAKMPMIAKGVLSLYDADQVLQAGVAGMVLSHHNNRITYAIPPLMLLPDSLPLTAGKCDVFVDCMIQTGMDAYKALALGAKGVCIGRPLMTAFKKDPANGVREYLTHAAGELAKAMAFTGCSDLTKMDPSVIHRAGL